MSDPASNSSWLATATAAAALAQSLVTFLAIIAGAIWFFRRRQRFPRANVTQSVVHWHARRQVIVHAVVRVSNVGEVALRLRECSIRISQLLPIAPEVLAALPSDGVGNSVSAEFPWPLVVERVLDWTGSEREIEPGEMDEILVDVVVPDDYELVRITTYIRNFSKSKDIGWIATTIYNIRRDADLAQATTPAAERQNVVEPPVQRGSRPRSRKGR